MKTSRSKPRKPRKRKLGVDGAKVWVAEDFDAPLPPDILAGFLGEEPEDLKAKAPTPEEIQPSLKGLPSKSKLSRH